MIETIATLDDGQIIKSIALSNGHLSATFLTYGAVLQDLRLANRPHSLVVGFDNWRSYAEHPGQFGALVGRCANRISDACFELDGVSFQLERNLEGRHHIHGGQNGSSKQIWTIRHFDNSELILELTMRDGDMGYPGNLNVKLTISILDCDALDFKIVAKTDAPTLCNFAHHSFFNLDHSTPALDQEIWINAERYLPLDQHSLPTGKVKNVTGTRLDFSAPAPINKALGCLDHNFCLSEARGPMRHAATLSAPTVDLAMQVHTGEPGLQVYDGRFMRHTNKSTNNAVVVAHSGIALEPQIWPNAIKHRHFPQAILRPGEQYLQHTRYQFKSNP